MDRCCRSSPLEASKYTAVTASQLTGGPMAADKDTFYLSMQVVNAPTLGYRDLPSSRDVGVQQIDCCLYLSDLGVSPEELALFCYCLLDLIAKT